MKQDEELHAELLKAFRAYFEANQDWVNKKTRRAGMDVRYWLSEIRRICSARRVEVQKWRYEVDSAKRQKKANQKAQGTEGDDTN